MYELDLANFRRAVKLKVTTDRAGKDVELVAAITLRDPHTGQRKTFERKVPLGQAIAAVQREIARTVGHGMALPPGADPAMFGLPPGTAVQGWFSDTLHKVESTTTHLYEQAKHVARRLGENKAVNLLYHDVAPLVVAAIPGGSDAMLLAEKAHDVVVKARAGDQHAVAQVQQLTTMANQGHPAACDTVAMMSKIAAMLQAKESCGSGHTDVAGWWYNKPFRDNLSAMNLDKSDPFTVARFLYAQGIAR